MERTIGTIVALALAAGFALAPPAKATPSGKIAFQSDRDGNYQIYVMNGDGSDQTRVTTPSVKSSTPRGHRMAAASPSEAVATAMARSTR